MRPQPLPASTALDLEDGWEDPADRMEEDEDSFDELGLAPIEDTPTTLRPRPTDRLLVENLAAENDILLEQEGENEEDLNEDAEIDFDFDDDTSGSDDLS